MQRYGHYGLGNAGVTSTLQAKIARKCDADVIRNGPIRASRFVWNGARGAILLLAEIAAKSPAMPP